MFENITAASNASKIGTVAIGAGVAGGIIFAIAKKKKFWGTVGYAVGFGLVGFIISTVVEQVSD